MKVPNKKEKEVIEQNDELYAMRKKYHQVTLPSCMWHLFPSLALNIKIETQAHSQIVMMRNNMKKTPSLRALWKIGLKSHINSLFNYCPQKTQFKFHFSDFVTLLLSTECCTIQA